MNNKLKYGIDLSVDFNRMPTPYKMITRDEFMWLTFFSHRMPSFPHHTMYYKQVLDLLEKKSVPVRFIDVFRSYVGVASYYAPRDWNSPKGWTPLDSEYGYTHFVAYYRVGCTHKHMEHSMLRQFEYSHVCPECGFSEVIDSS